MHYIGSDLHKKTITMHVVNQDRQKIAAQRFSCSDPQGIVKWLMQHRPFQLVVEATASYEWFVQLVEPIATRSYISIAVACRHPLFCSPSNQSTGMRTSVKNTSLK